MKLKILSVCMLCVAISLSCKKEDLLTTESPQSLLLSQILVDKTPSFEYTYNSAKFINEEKSTFAYSVNHYNESNQLVTAEYYANIDILSNNPLVSEAAINQKTWFNPNKSNMTGSIKYEYNDKGQLIKTIYTPSTGSQESSQFSYNEDENINDQRLYWENNPVGHIEYLYDFAGNLVEETLFTVSAAGGEELNTTTVYDYDKKQNPYKLISRLMTPGINTNRNNITMETHTIHLSAAQGGDIVVITKNSYKYNASGYPIAKNGNIEYIYQ